MGVEPNSPCANLEHLGDLLKKRVYSQQNHSIYEVWRPKIAEAIGKQTVRRLRWDGNVPGICAGDQGCCGPQPNACHKILEGELDHQLPPLLEQGGLHSVSRHLDAGSHWGETVHIHWDCRHWHQKNGGAEQHLKKG